MRPVRPLLAGKLLTGQAVAPALGLRAGADCSYHFTAGRRRGDRCCRNSVSLPSTRRRTLPGVNSWGGWAGLRWSWPQPLEDSWHCRAMPRDRHSSVGRAHPASAREGYKARPVVMGGGVSAHQPVIASGNDADADNDRRAQGRCGLPPGEPHRPFIIVQVRLNSWSRSS
jgi:hypothetical protein